MSGLNQSDKGKAPIASGPGGGAPSGPAGGDLSGTYPNPTVVDLTMTGEAQGGLVRRNAAAWGYFDANDSGTVVSGDGTDVVSQAIATVLAVAPTANRAAIYPTTTPSLTSSAGWTIVDAGTAVGVVAGGAFTVTIESIGSGGVADTSGATRALPTVGQAFQVVFSASIDTAGAGTVYGGVRLAFGAVTLIVFLADQGTLGVDDGAYTAVVAGQPIDGTLWTLCTFDGDQLVVWTAIGTTTVAPTGLWIKRATITVNAAASPATTVALFGTHNAGLALGADVVVAVRNLSITPR